MMGVRSEYMEERYPGMSHTLLAAMLTQRGWDKVQRLCARDRLRAAAQLHSPKNCGVSAKGLLKAFMKACERRSSGVWIWIWAATAAREYMQCACVCRLGSWHCLVSTGYRR